MQKSQNEQLHVAFEILKIEKKIDKLYEQAHLLVNKIAFSILKNKEEAEDISQEVFAKLLMLSPNKLPKEKETCWLYTVVKNECFCYLRKQKPTLNIDDIYEISIEEQDINELVERESFNQLISQLPEIEKQILSLKLLSHFTFCEIGTMLGMPTATIQWRYYKSIHSLKTILSSFTGFMITLFLGIGLWKNSIIKTNETQQESNQIENSNDTLPNENNNQGQTDDKNRNEQNQVVNSEMENMKENEITSDVINQEIGNSEQQQVQQSWSIGSAIMVGSFLISFIFLGITIFSIFTKKAQQKRKKKSSNKKQK